MKKILIADDEESIRVMLSALLKKRGYAFETAKNGQEALSALERSDFDLILSDIDMPGMNGMELAQNLTSAIPIIFMSGRKENFNEMEKLGVENCKGYLPKPFPLQDLLKKIKEVLGEE